MRARPAFALALTLALALLLPAAPAAAAPLASAVTAADPDLGKPSTGRRALLAYIDADMDQALDAAGPEEPVYLDLDASGQVSYGDLRLTPFAGFVPSSDVLPADPDNGRELTATGGWFARAGAAWYADLDGSMTVTVGDLRLDPGSRVAAGDAALGTALDVPTGMPQQQAALVDTSGDGRRTPGEGVVLDADLSRSVTAGDLRLATGAVPPAVQLQDTPGEQGDATASAGSGGGVRGLDLLLLGLAALNLVGLAILARRGGGPREPPGAP